MTLCTTQSSVCRTMTNLCLQSHVQLSVSISVQWMFDVDHETNLEICITLLTIVRNYEL